MGYLTPWAPVYLIGFKDPEFLRYDRERFAVPPLAQIGSCAVDSPRDSDQLPGVPNVNMLLEAGIWADSATWEERVPQSSSYLAKLLSRRDIVLMSYDGRRGPMLSVKPRFTPEEFRGRVSYWRKWFSCLPRIP